jgi:hypothetical protein
MGIFIFPEEVVLYPMESETLSAFIWPENATDTIVWHSADSEIATVNDGVVMALKAGTTTITASTKDGNLSSESMITVLPNGAVKSVNLDQFRIELNPNGSCQITATVETNVEANKGVIWSASPSGIITITQQSAGIATITASAQQGTVSATLTATSTADPTKKASCEVTVNVGYQFNDGSEIWGMALDNNGGIYMTGRVNNDFDRHYTAYLKNDLTLGWYNNSYGGEQWACASDGVNGYICTWGGPIIKFSPNTPSPLAISNPPNGGYQIAVDISGNTYSTDNYGVSSLTADLQTVRWTYRFLDFDIISSHIIVGGDGFVYFVGVYYGSRNYGAIVKLNPANGSVIWKDFFNTSDNAQDARIAVNTNGLVMVSAGNESTFRWNSSGTKLSNLPYIPMITSYKTSFYGFTEGTLCEFDHNGDIKTEYKNVGVIFWGEVLVDENYIYVGAESTVKRYVK